MKNLLYAEEDYNCFFFLLSFRKKANKYRVGAAQITFDIFVETGET